MRRHSSSLQMPANNQRRMTEALESIARSSQRLATTLEQMAEAERERASFFAWLRGLLYEQPAAHGGKRAGPGNGGGMLDESGLPRGPHGGPGGVPALPDPRQRPCINVTPAKAEKTGRKWLW